jgi:hypothetical protein
MRSGRAVMMQLLEGPRMSSESNERKPDSAPSPPSAAERRVSARAPSAWGAARDALAAVHNLEALLRSATVANRTILDLLPELRSSADVLREAFDAALGGEATTAAVGAYGGVRVDEFGRLLDATAIAAEDRGALAYRAHFLADELESSADLLALLERASAPVPNEVSINLIVRETARMSGTGRGRELIVRFDEASPDCVVTTDPYAVGPLLAIAVARVYGEGNGEIAVRARCTPPNATLVVEAAGPPDFALPVTAMRVLPAVAPTEMAARRVAERIGSLLKIDPARWAIVVTSAAC